jgi:cysteine desulfuration protein SufE
MAVNDIKTHKELQRELIEELMALQTPEDRLSWLMERAPLHDPLSQSDLIPSRKVPGCLSGLWLKGELREGLCHYSAYSESDLVHGVVSFVCDIYSCRTAEEVTTISDSLVQKLRLDGLLSTTRKRALSSTLSFIIHHAAQHNQPQSLSRASAA